MRVGDLFGWADGTTTVIGPVGGPGWDALAIGVATDHIQADRLHWTIDHCEGNPNS
jgi:hypothetical protein